MKQDGAAGPIWPAGHRKSGQKWDVRGMGKRLRVRTESARAAGYSLGIQNSRLYPGLDPLVHRASLIVAALKGFEGMPSIMSLR
jgi:hypothetical protein